MKLIVLLLKTSVGILTALICHSKSCGLISRKLLLRLWPGSVSWVEMASCQLAYPSPPPSPDSSLPALVSTWWSVGLLEFWAVNSDGLHPKRISGTIPLHSMIIPVTSLQSYSPVRIGLLWDIWTRVKAIPNYPQACVHSLTRPPPNTLSQCMMDSWAMGVCKPSYLN